MKKSMILALSITLAVLAVLALGILVYFKFFALVYDKDGIQIKETRFFGGESNVSRLHLTPKVTPTYACRNS